MTRVKETSIKVPRRSDRFYAIISLHALLNRFLAILAFSFQLYANVQKRPQEIRVRKLHACALMVSSYVLQKKLSSTHRLQRFRCLERNASASRTRLRRMILRFL